jgi:Family of unknown function (DUF6502)
MSSRPPPVTPVPATASGTASEQQALQDAVVGLMAPLARLAVARGMPFAEVEEMLKMAFVQAANGNHAALLPHRRVSRISTATGINRREVTRLMQAQPRAAPARSLASEVFMMWRNQRPYRDASGLPKVLPRQGPKPSFETLAQAVTRDVHPRSLLDELCRLGLASWDESSDQVSLSREAFVPQGDRVRMLGFLGENVGDHLRAAVDNVLTKDRVHFEQSVYADGLHEASMLFVRPIISQQWAGLMAALVPELEARVSADSAIEPPAQGRLRIGLYSYQETPSDAPLPAAALSPKAGRPSKKDSK